MLAVQASLHAEPLVALDGSGPPDARCCAAKTVSPWQWTIDTMTRPERGLLIGITEVAVLLTAEYTKTAGAVSHSIAMFQGPAGLDSQVFRPITLLDM